MVSDEGVKKFQELFEKEYHKKLTWDEARESAENLVGFVGLIMDISREENIRQERLKKEPKGFHLEGTYTCCVCGVSISNEETWYDKYGTKCLICQRAVDKHVIPGSVCKNKDSWYSTWDLQNKYNIRFQTARKMMREGKLKARIIKDESGRPHCYVFLIKDNPNFLMKK